MPRTAVALAMLAICAGAPAAAQAATPVPTPERTPASTPLPPDLVALEQKMAALQITSLRFAVATKVTERHPSRLSKLLKLFGLGSTIVGEETLTPPAANVTLGLFGVSFTLRIIGAASWVYFRQLAGLDGRRPWVRLGPGGLFELFTVEDEKGPRTPRVAPLAPTLGQPDYAQPPFAKLAATLAGAAAVSELGPTVVDSVPVTSFLATLRPGQLESGRAVRTSPLIVIRGRSRRHVRLPPPPKPTISLEVSFAATGMPVRLVLTEKLPGFTTTGTVDFPAVNFPLAIEPPAAAETISVAQLKALEAKQKRDRAARHKHHKSKQ